jgi:phosphoenolpyruvate carboxykinase (ATP)
MPFIACVNAKSPTAGRCYNLKGNDLSEKKSRCKRPESLSDLNLLTLEDQMSVGLSQPHLEAIGLETEGTVFWNCPTATLYEQAVKRGEANIADSGALVATTSPHTGRSPKDKFLVREPSSQDQVWWGSINQQISVEHFQRLHDRVQRYIRTSDLFVQDVLACADPEYQLPIRVISEFAWHSLFVRNMFLAGARDVREERGPGFTIVDLPRLVSRPDEDGTRSETFIVINLAERVVLIGGTMYAGEIKKSVFSVLNYLLPERGVLPMHCSANVGKDGQVAVFFGLSGTGKTTLSADPERMLIGDDEHGWSEHGVFNFEAGCYAKVIRLSAEAEPEIYATTRMFGTVLENVVVDPYTRGMDLEDDQLTENTRASYPLRFIPNASPTGTGGHPSNIVFLTADAYGVLPPISRLSIPQARYHFLSGYTAKVSGTENGVTEPQPNFSTCFGAPFLPLHPSVYSRTLGERLERHKSQVWLVNTGWSGGIYGVGERMKIAHTRAMVHAALNGTLAQVPTEPDPIFGVAVPVRCPGVPTEVLQPRNTWPDAAAYDAQAKSLARMFAENFAQFADLVPLEVREAGPRPD